MQININEMQIIVLILALLMLFIILHLVLMIKYYSNKSKAIRENYLEMKIKNEELVSVEKELRDQYSILQEKEEKINNLAFYDSLTKLPNRYYLNEKFKEILEDSIGKDIVGAVLFIDLDNFKNVNDTLGHDYGDQLLKIIGEILRIILPESNLLFRWGGDEFVIILPYFCDNNEVIKVSDIIIEALQKPFEIGEIHVYVTPSIGIVRYPDNGIDVNTIIKNADMAMYKAKCTGKNRYQFYNEVLNEEINRKTILEKELRCAQNNNELTILYQPQVDASSRKIKGMEALLRWKNKSLGDITPIEFIPIAEERKLIIPIGEWVLKNACLANVKLVEKGYSLIVSVNVSPVQFQQENFIQVVENVLRETGLPAELLQIEITENILLKSSEYNILEKLRALRSMGVKIALDDFGTGYSSLSYLKLLPINELKIDQSFIRDLHFDKNVESILKCIIDLAHTLQLSVTTEGVEMKEQAEMLLGINCDVFQGYYFSRPITYDNLCDIVGKIFYI